MDSDQEPTRPLNDEFREIGVLYTSSALLLCLNALTARPCGAAGKSFAGTLFHAILLNFAKIPPPSIP